MFQRLRELRRLQQEPRRRQRGLSPVSASIQHDIDAREEERRVRLDVEQLREEQRWRRRQQEQQEARRPARALIEHSIRDWEQRQERQRERRSLEERSHPPDCDGSVNRPILSTGIVVQVDRLAHEVQVRAGGDWVIGDEEKTGCDVYPAWRGRTFPLGGDVCPICMNEYRRGERVRYSGACCRQAYHAACIDRWLRIAPGEKKEECPCCRQRMGTDADADAAAEAANLSRLREQMDLTSSYLERISLYGTINTDLGSPVSSPSPPPPPAAAAPSPPPKAWPGIVVLPIKD